MQRAAASAPSTTLQSHSSPQAHIPDTLPPPSKRRKFDSDTETSVPPPPSDLQDIQAALDEDEAKRESAIERLGEEAGETKWVLSTLSDAEQWKYGGPQHSGLRVTSTGYSEIEIGAMKPAMIGRRYFGRPNKQVEVRLPEKDARWCLRLYTLV